jgi:zinc protease
LKIKPPSGKLVKEVKKGIEYKSTVYMIFHGEKPINPKTKFDFKAMLAVLDMILTDSIRESEGGTYGVGSYGYQIKYPSEKNMTFIYFGTDPDRVEELTNSTLRIIKHLQNNVVDPVYFTKLTET